MLTNTVSRRWGVAKFQHTDFKEGQVFSAPTSRGGAKFQCVEDSKSDRSPNSIAGIILADVINLPYSF